MSVPIYGKVIIANSLSAFAVIVALLTSPTTLVAGFVVIAAGLTNALLVRAAFAVEGQRRRYREVLAYTLETNEIERKQVAQRLQDDAAQRLAALVLSSSTQREFSREAAAVMEDLYAAAGLLHPATISLLGLGSAIRAHTRTLNMRFGLDVDLTVDPRIDQLDQALALGIYRILEDVLDNAGRRGAKFVAVKLECNRTSVTAALHMQNTLTQAEYFRIGERVALLGGRSETMPNDTTAILTISIPLGVTNEHARYDSRLAG